MSRAWDFGRRAATATLLAIGLVLTHGGPVRAVTCANVAGMTPSAPTAGMQHESTHARHSAPNHSVHHQPADQPSGAQAGDVCTMPAPMTGDGAAPKPGHVATVSRVIALVIPRSSSMSLAADRRPSPPDLISALCVNRR